MTLVTAAVWFIISATAAPLESTSGPGVSTIGPFTTKAQCEATRLEVSDIVDNRFIGHPFRDRSVCKQMTVVVGAK